MSRLEPADKIEDIVGAPRHPELHIGRAVSSEQRAYILHSQRCFDRLDDLRQCPYSLALDAGIEAESWIEDEPVLLSIDYGRLVGTATYQPLPAGRTADTYAPLPNVTTSDRTTDA